MTNTHYERATKYRLSRLAAENSEDPHFLRAALEKQIESFPWYDEDDAQVVVAGALASEEGIKVTLSAYVGKYDEALGRMKMNEFLDDSVYGRDLRGFLGDGSEKHQRALAKFREYSDETYGSIVKKIKEASAVKKVKAMAKDLGISADAVKQAEETLKKYSNIMTILTALEANKLEALRPAIKERATKRILESILGE